MQLQLFSIDTNYILSFLFFILCVCVFLIFGRTELLECYGDQDFLAKLHCVRQAFQVGLHLPNRHSCKEKNSETTHEYKFIHVIKGT